MKRDPQTTELTKRWCRNKSDEYAVKDGYWFDLERASFAIWWIESHIVLYEGNNAGEPLRLKSAADEPEWEIPDYFDWEDEYIHDLFSERQEWHLSQTENGHFMDWQYEVISRIFGWVHQSEHFSQVVRRFREAGVFVAKKNKKSPTMAATAMYLAFGDGEPGNNVMLAAKDGAQARMIGAQHCVQAYEQSTKLRESLKLNKNLMQLTDKNSRSRLFPLSSSNTRTQASKEGLNGSIVVDETHVVDRAFVDIISRAGISRAEPLFSTWSTAGIDNSGFGREWFDYGLRIQSGEVRNNAHFSYVAAIPQTATDHEIHADPLGHIKMANPAYGHTIDPAEVMADYDRSKISPSGFAKFKMYRLNQWTAAETTFIKETSWSECGDDIRIEDFEGKTCWCGLDIASTRDLTCFTMIFDVDGIPYVFTDSWMTRMRANEENEIVPYLGWSKTVSAQLTLLPGQVINEDLVFNDIKARAEQFNIREIHFDPNKSRHLLKLIEEDLGIEMVIFRQSTREFSPHLDAMERHILEGTLRHNNNPVVLEHLRNAQCYEDKHGYRMLVKPELGGEHKKIDAAVSMVMAMRGWTLRSPEAAAIGSSYANEELRKIFF